MQDRPYGSSSPQRKPTESIYSLTLTGLKESRREKTNIKIPTIVPNFEQLPTQSNIEAMLRLSYKKRSNIALVKAPPRETSPIKKVESYSRAINSLGTEGDDRIDVGNTRVRQLVHKSCEPNRVPSMSEAIPTVNSILSLYKIKAEPKLGLDVKARSISVTSRGSIRKEPINIPVQNKDSPPSPIPYTKLHKQPHIPAISLEKMSVEQIVQNSKRFIQMMPVPPENILEKEYPDLGIINYKGIHKGTIGQFHLTARKIKSASREESRTVRGYTDRISPREQLGINMIKESARKLKQENQAFESLIGDKDDDLDDSKLIQRTEPDLVESKIDLMRRTNPRLHTYQSVSNAPSYKKANLIENKRIHLSPYLKKMQAPPTKENTDILLSDLIRPYDGRSQRSKKWGL